MNPLFRIDFSISDSLKIVRKSVLIYETIIVRHVQLKLSPGARHEVLNELNRQQVYGDVLDFLQQWAAVDKPEQT